MGIWDSLVSLIRAIWEFVQEFWVLIVIVACIVIAIWFPATWAVIIGYIEALGLWIQTLTWPQILALLGGLAFLIAPDKVGDAIGGVIESVGDATSSVISSTLDSILNSPTGFVILVGGAGLLAWTILRDDSGGELTPDTQYSESEPSDSNVIDRAEYTRVPPIPSRSVMEMRSDNEGSSETTEIGQPADLDGSVWWVDEVVVA